ncbi:restriction endonuclease subunit S [Gluconobacter kondonii]|uniref:restriction endonuclease subunit S n=1 Tax=Gluconobacter kondonii TaxID=941463 RepID=UPI001B8CC56B|nr:restriction endonuclease subunit S [Gluconobacter kondonii]MBS1083988.1 restriction endonuclease subunit S [Gluconobacter kondonii]
MSFPAYPEYKDSGVEWVGKIPAHWEVCPLMGIAIERFERNAGMIEDNLLSLSYGKIIKKDIFGNDGLLPESFETYQVIYPGDIILRLTDLQNDKRSLRSALVEEKGIITSAYLSLYPHGIDSVFFAYLLRAYDLTKVFYSMGGGLRQSMKFSDMKRIPIILPLLEEQTAIAAFLDRETGKIDALIAEQEKLLTLLAEKRQATISHAVTRGLNPNAPMKDSGIAWLGEVPEHWDIQRIKDLTSVISKGTTPTTIGRSFSESGVRFLKAENIFDSKIQTTPENFIDEDTHLLLSRSKLLSGDVLIVIAGATTGKSAIVNDSIVPCNTNQAICFIRPKKNKYTEVIQYWIQSRGVQNFIKDMAVQSAQPNLSMEDLGNIHIAFSSDSKERLNIKKYIENHDIHISKISKLIEQSIALLKERRSALIAAAVTGKIDVRNAVPQGEAA